MSKSANNDFLIVGDKIHDAPDSESAQVSLVAKLTKESLRKHVAVLGSSGSGKTVFAKVLLEELALAGVPSIIIDLQGDLARLAEPPSKDPAVDKKRAASWKRNVEVRVWTPMSASGLQMCIDPFFISSSNRAPEEIIASWDRAASGITSLLEYKPTSVAHDKVRGFLFEHLSRLAEAGEHPQNFGELATSIRNTDFPSNEDILKISEIEEIARRAEAKNIGSGAVLYSSGVPLDIPLLLEPMKSGKTPVNILYLNSLPTDQAKQSFIQQLTRQIYDWMIANPNSEDLQCALFLDEAAPYLPPDPRMPTAKSGLRALFEQGRKFGVSCIVATQSPGRLDYIVLGQANTIAIGRFSQKQEISKIKNLLSSASNPKEITDSLPSLPPGNLFLHSPDNFENVQKINTRWLITPHGSPLNSRQIEPLVSKEMRDWADSKARRNPKRAKPPSWLEKITQKSRIGLHTTNEKGSEYVRTTPRFNDPLTVLLALTGVLSVLSLATSTLDLFELTNNKLRLFLVFSGVILTFTMLIRYLTIEFTKLERWPFNYLATSNSHFEIITLIWFTILLVIVDLDVIRLESSLSLIVAAQTILLTQIILDRIQIGKLKGIQFAEKNILQRIRTLGDFITTDERNEIQKSSVNLFARFGMLTFITSVILFSGVIWYGFDISTGQGKDLAIRVLVLQYAYFISIGVAGWFKFKDFS